jgi:hypothetical protein
MWGQGVGSKYKTEKFLADTVGNNSIIKRRRNIFNELFPRRGTIVREPTQRLDVEVP